MSGGEKIEMIIDCDPGVDDAVAIMMALSQPSVNLLGLTCVGGNTPIDNVLRNALRVLRLCERTDVPVFRGSGSSLLHDSIKDAHHVHGSDGLGGVPDPDPPSLDLVQSEHAVHAMIRMTKEKPGQVTMVAIGPLTNLALAIRLDPGFTGRLKKLVIMGGNTEGSGSMTDAAEFNFFSDPEAAHIVLQDVKCPTIVVGWETCLKNGLSWEWFDKWSATPTPKGKFINAILAGHFMKYERGKAKRPLFKVCDALAMAIVIHPEMVLESVTCPVMIELGGQVTRGQMVQRVKNTEGLPLGPEVEVVMWCNTEIFREMFEDILKD
ncbi:pyrimidine-specific ribonucleoside hydrolase RihA-like isoform X1 [Asterias amurensis]|uniref:pyrimidine-specific ribonucleoside hydrolase RihA-like isoform X1 n=1 Tax=Asterias amurensis TaxID=7602 RepID=UPI003AB3A9AA